MEANHIESPEPPLNFNSGRDTPVAELGAGQVASVDGPLTDDTITYTYDELGRVTSRAINGVAASQTYDALGRTTAETKRPRDVHARVRRGDWH